MAQFDRDDTVQKITTIVVDTLKIDKGSITQDSEFEQLGADSLDMLEIVMKLEELFGIQIDDDKAAAIKTFKQAVDLIHQMRTK